MKKSDLKYGNVIEERDGYKCVVYCNKTEKALISLITGMCVNLDHYREDLTDIEGLIGFDVVKVYEDYTCKKLLWERKEKLKPKLTEDEKVILRNIGKTFKWITRDEYWTLGFHSSKPHKEAYFWSSLGANYVGDLFPNLFKFIKWEDDEPYLIEDLLEGENND